MGEQKLTVSYAVEEHMDREVDTVSVNPNELSEGVSIEEKAVDKVCDRSIYTHVETLSITPQTTP